MNAGTWVFVALVAGVFAISAVYQSIENSVETRVRMQYLETELRSMQADSNAVRPDTCRVDGGTR